MTFTNMKSKIYTFLNGGRGPELPGAETGYTAWNCAPLQPVMNRLFWRLLALKGDASLGVLVLSSGWPFALNICGHLGRRASWEGFVLLRKCLCLNVMWTAQTYKLLCKSISPNHLSLTERRGGLESFPNEAFICSPNWFWNNIQKFTKTKSSHAIPHLLHLY